MEKSVGASLRKNPNVFKIANTRWNAYQLDRLRGENDKRNRNPVFASRPEDC
jgi:hypothetical protein